MEANAIVDTTVAIGSHGPGLITVFTVLEHPPAANYFDVVLPEVRDYARAADLAIALRRNGTPIGAVDVMIAAMCINRNAKVVTKDRDFLVVREVVPEFEIEFQI